MCSYIDENEQKWYAECEEIDRRYGRFDDEYDDDDDFDYEEDEEEFQRLYQSFDRLASRASKSGGGIVFFGL